MSLIDKKNIVSNVLKYVFFSGISSLSVCRYIYIYDIIIILIYGTTSFKIWIHYILYMMYQLNEQKMIKALIYPIGVYNESVFLKKCGHLHQKTTIYRESKYYLFQASLSSFAFSLKQNNEERKDTANLSRARGQTFFKREWRVN